MPANPSNPQHASSPADETATFTDPQTNRQVTAVPITATNLKRYQQQLQQTAGLTPPVPKIGDWLITQAGADATAGAGLPGGMPQLVPQQDFLARYSPASDQARQLLRQLAQTPTSGPQGNAGGQSGQGQGGQSGR
jgi:hypothetical protein